MLPGRKRPVWPAEGHQQTVELRLSESAPTVPGLREPAWAAAATFAAEGRTLPPSKPRGWRLAARPAVVTAAASGPGAHGSKGQRAQWDRRETGKTKRHSDLGEERHTGYYACGLDSRPTCRAPIFSSALLLHIFKPGS